MKSRGLFPGPRSRPRRSGFGGAAGNSSSSNKPGPSGDGYKTGMLGGRESRQAGGQTMAQKRAGQALQTESMPGRGGLAYDSSCSSIYKGDP